MKTSDFNYYLPPELIAQEPLPDRTGSRMMVVRRKSGEFEHKHVADLPEYLESGDLLVVNDTRVIPARVFGHRADTGGKVELLLIEENCDQKNSKQTRNHEPGTTNSPKGAIIWWALYRASRPAKKGIVLSLANGKIQGEIIEVEKEGRILVKLSGDCPLFEILDEEGFAPVPPYIKRNKAGVFSVNHSQSTINDGLSNSADASLKELDRRRYQTIYARHPGAVAAPTAGLHFTKEIFEDLEKHGVRRTAVTLHVGLGTFKPVKTELVENHVMEEERYIINEKAVETINRTRRGGGKIVAVGSTTVRALETVAAERGSLAPCSGRSSLFINPPFEFKVVDAMLTNFHLPMSSLIMMVSAFAGSCCERTGRELVLRAYNEAIERNYRFYSYGDCMLIL